MSSGNGFWVRGRDNFLLPSQPWDSAWLEPVQLNFYSSFLYLKHHIPYKGKETFRLALGCSKTSTQLHSIKKYGAVRSQADFSSLSYHQRLPLLCLSCFWTQFCVLLTCVCSQPYLTRLYTVQFLVEIRQVACGVHFLWWIIKGQPFLGVFHCLAWGTTLRLARCSAPSFSLSFLFLLSMSGFQCWRFWCTHLCVWTPWHISIFFLYRDVWKTKTFLEYSRSTPFS